MRPFLCQCAGIIATLLIAAAPGSDYADLAKTKAAAEAKDWGTALAADYYRKSLAIRPNLADFRTCLALAQQNKP